jgi:hypothetical protein
MSKANLVMGTKFEMWLEGLYNDLSHSKVRRNVKYFKVSNNYRQVDVEFHEWAIWNSHVIVEAKYSINKARFSIEPRRKRFCKRAIDNIVHELEERRKYVGASRAILVTNKQFESGVYKEAENFSRIQVYDLGDLEKMNLERRGIFDYFKEQKSIERQIKGMRIPRKRIKSHKEYMFNRK